MLNAAESKSFSLHMHSNNLIFFFSLVIFTRDWQRSMVALCSHCNILSVCACFCATIIPVLPTCFNLFFVRRHSLTWNISQGCTTGTPAPMHGLRFATSAKTACPGSRLTASPAKVGSAHGHATCYYNRMVTCRFVCSVFLYNSLFVCAFFFFFFWCLISVLGHRWTYSLFEHQAWCNVALDHLGCKSGSKQVCT